MTRYIALGGRCNLPCNLAHLESLDSRTVWPNEVGDFSPWLARPENLALLGETLNLDFDTTDRIIGAWPS